MKPTYEPGDVQVKRFDLISPDLKARAVPLDQLVGFDVWEDITKPTLYACFYFVDSVGLLDKFPVLGQEEVNVEFQTPGMPRSVFYKFKSFEVANVIRSPNDKSVTFTLKCVSVEHFYNAASTQQSYKGVISEIVPQLVSKHLHSKKQVIIDPTRGLQTITFPTLSPIQAIDMCRQRAVSVKYPTSSYVFFENQSGFVFKTVEGLIESGVASIGSRVFNADQNSTSDKYSDRLAYRTVLSYENIARVDVNEMLDKGAYGGVVKTFDLFTKQFTHTEQQTSDMFYKITTTDKGAQFPSSANFIEKFGRHNGRHQHLVPKTTLEPDNFIDSAAAMRHSFSVLLNNNTTRVLIHGDSGLKVGDVVTLNLPAATGLTGRTEKQPLVSGNYLITRLRHIINISTKSKHQISFDAVKVGFTK